MKAAALAFAVLTLATFARADAPPEISAPPGVQLHVGDADDTDATGAIANLPPDVRARLTGDQVESILRRSQEARTASMASTVVPAIFFVSIVGVVIAVLIGRHRRDRILHETLRAMIEKGAEIPHELLGPPQKKVDDRRRGIILVAAGTGLGAFLFAVDRSDTAWAFGFVPLLLGAGYLVAWALGRNDAAKQA